MKQGDKPAADALLGRTVEELPSLSALRAVQRLGDYLLLEVLGQGGMGVVYRAEHVVSGKQVALKTVRMPKAMLLARMRREIRALARLRHPGVVRIVAEGVEGGVPWYAMELLGGMPLHHYFMHLRGVEDGGPTVFAGDDGLSPEATAPSEPEELPTQADVAAQKFLEDSRSVWWTRMLVPADKARPTPGEPAKGVASSAEPPREAQAEAVVRRKPRVAGGVLMPILRVMRKLCVTLAYLHGEGVVHRDLKPDNILVLPNGWPVLVDFGLSTDRGGQLQRAHLQVERTIGTPGYMAPEQIRGEQVDARTDLYALGCILYKLLTGRLPFVADKPSSLFVKHLFEQPQPPSSFVDGVPPRLDTLVLRLLAKDPNERIGHAGDVDAMLEKVGAYEQAPLPAMPRSRAYLYRPGFVSREAQIKRVLEQVTQLRSGTGGFFFIGGESGIGKTRLVAHCVTKAQRLPVMILTGKCLPAARSQGTLGGMSAGPLQALRQPLQMLADHCREQGSAETQRIFGARARVLGLYEPSLLALPGIEATPEPAQLLPSVARLRLMNTLMKTFVLAAHDQPILLVIDDLQWADALTLQFFSFLRKQRVLARAPLALLATFRPEEANDALRALLSVPESQELLLERISEEGIARMVHNMLAFAHPPAALVRFLARHSEGNPFFVVEYLRTALAEGLLYRDEWGRWRVKGDGEADDVYERLPVPISLRHLISQRLDRLTPAEQEILALASCFGVEVDEEALVQLATSRKLPWMESLRELLTRQLLEESSPGRLRFVHDKIREVAYERLTESETRDNHRDIAIQMELARGKGARVELGELAAHWERAEEIDSARRAYLEAARDAVAHYTHEDAETFYERFLALYDEPTPEALEARRELAQEVLSVSGKFEQAHRLLEETLALCQSQDARREEANVLYALGELLHLMGRVQEAMDSFSHALTLFGGLQDKHGRARTLRFLAVLQSERGENEKAVALYTQALFLWGEVGDKQGEAQTLHSFAALHMERGQFKRAKELFDEALQLHRATNSRLQEARTLNNLAHLYTEQGRFAPALQFAQNSLLLRREIGDRSGEGAALNNLAMIYLRQRRYQQAQSLYQDALTIWQELGHQRGEAYALNNLASILRDQGQIEEALHHYEEALQLAIQLKDKRLEAYNILFQAQLARYEELFEEARRGVLEAKQLFTELQHVIGLVLCRCEEGFLRLVEGQEVAKLILEIKGTMKALHILPTSESGIALTHLERAFSAFQAGGILPCGQHPEDLPPAIAASYEHMIARLSHPKGTK